MAKLIIHNANFITCKTVLFTIDILGGVDLSQVERMICTLRISYKNYPPHRSTLDLYNDRQSDKLLRSLCDKWELKLVDVSKTLHELTLQLEDYRLEQLKFKGKYHRPQFEPNEADQKEAIKTLKSKSLLKQLVTKLNTTGIIGEDDNATILFLALASHKFSNPFSVLCLAKSGIGKSYVLQKLADCMPQGAYSFHTRISSNALYYFDSSNIQNKALLIEDLEWTMQMLTPLATLQSQGKLIHTRTTKNKDGMLHSTTFEVIGKLCLIACAYSDKNLESLSLPFLMIHLNHSAAQDRAIMDYQRAVSAGLVELHTIQKAQHELKCIVASLENISIINPYATLIELPADVAHPRKSLQLLLNFIEVITYFFQWQRHRQVNKDTGEIYIATTPEDIALAFRLLKNSLLRRADELSTTTRGFYHWLTGYLTEAKTNQFTALDIRKVRSVHPRTLNRYLQELKLYSYIKVTGGNKHRGGYIYKLTELGNQTDVQNRIEQALQNNLEQIQQAYQKQQEHTDNTKSQLSRSVSQKAVSNS